MLVQRNANDVLVLLSELATESGDDYIQAKSIHAEMLREYVEHMEKRSLSGLLALLHPKLSPSKQLAHIVADLGEPLRLSQGREADRQNEARKKIEAATMAIAQFFIRLEQFSGIRIITFRSEVISEELRNAIKISLVEAHEIVGECAENPTVDSAEAACMANRKAMVYLYLARFGYQDFVNQEELKKFRRDINRTIYYNRVLQQTYKEDDPNHKRLGAYSNSELRRLRLLQAIIDNDIQQAREVLKTAIEEAIPGIEI